MAISLTHTTTSAEPDSGDGKISSNAWNEAHTLTMATARILGRTTAGTGAVEELTVGAGLTLSSGSLTLDETAVISDAAYGAGWNGDTGTAPSKNAVYDKIEALLANTSDVWIPASGMSPRVTSGAAWGSGETSTNKNNRVTLDFDASSAEYAQFFWRMPKSWNESTVTFIPIWSHPSTATNFGVVWQLSGVAISNDDTLEVAQGTPQTSTDTGGTTDDLYAGPESSAITIGGTPAEGDYVTFEVSRLPTDGSDTMAVDARLHGIVLRIVTNALTDA